MAADERRLTPTFPLAADIDWQRVEYDYDRQSDTVYLHLFGFGQPSIVTHTLGDIDLLVDPSSALVVGFQIENFLTRVVARNPRYLSLARNAGIDPDELDRIERSIDPADRKRADFQALADQQLLTRP